MGTLNGREVIFKVMIENDYYYGFVWKEAPISTPELYEIVYSVSTEYKCSQNWAGWRYPDYSEDSTRHDINFWSFYKNTALNRLLDHSQREAFVKEVATEMHEQIVKFKEKAGL